MAEQQENSKPCQPEDSKPCQPEVSKPCQPEDSKQLEEMLAVQCNVLAMVESFSQPVGKQQEPGKHTSSCFDVSSCCFSKTRQMHGIVG